MKLEEFVVDSCCPSCPGILRGWVSKKEIEEAEDKEEFLFDEYKIISVDHTWGHCAFNRDENASFVYFDDNFEGKQGGFKVTIVEVEKRDDLNG